MKTDYPELNEFNLEQLKERLAKSELEREKFRRILEENDLLDASSNISDVERICIEEISKLKELSERGEGLTLEDVKILDILHANLLKSRGLNKDDKGKKQKPVDIKKMLSIVEGSKK